MEAWSRGVEDGVVIKEHPFTQKSSKIMTNFSQDLRGLMDIKTTDKLYSIITGIMLCMEKWLLMTLVVRMLSAQQASPNKCQTMVNFEVFSKRVSHRRIKTQ